MKARTVAVLILAGLILAPVVMQAQSEQPVPAAPAAPAEPQESLNRSTRAHIGGR